MTNTSSEGIEENWTGWKQYMGTKIYKLDQQFDIAKPADGRGFCSSSIFQGVAIFVLGYTVPVASELKRLMQLHGGRYHSYKLSSTTHTIASTLAAGKLRTMRAKNELIVRPDWIIESINAGRLLNEEPYLLSGQAITTESRQGQLPESSKSEQPRAHSRNCSAEPSTSGPAILETEVGHSSKAVPKTTDDNFVSDFYSNSRLHFISTLAQEMKDYVRRVRTSDSELKFSGKKLLEDRVRNEKSQNPLTGGFVEEHAAFMPKSSFYMHVDMDCFFVSVGILKRPHLVGKSVAICHSKGIGPRSHADATAAASDFKSHAEIASCSYEARAAGVKNGMFLGSARKLCPTLIPISYDFTEYRETSQKLYNIILEYTDVLEPVSCDEMYVDIGDLCREVGITPEALATEIRERIFRETHCKASIGMGSTLLAARLATKKAKPDGQYLILPEDLLSCVSDLSLENMPGFGYATLEKLKPLNVEKCRDFLDYPKNELVGLLGAKTYEKLSKACMGEDGRKIERCPQGRKSISCTINYGIRLKTGEEAEKFLADLSSEVSRRMKAANVAGRQISLQLLIRAKDAPVETTKFLGCGHCDAVSKSKEIGFPTDDSDILKRESVKLLKEINPVVSDIRGVGIFVQKLGDKFAGSGKRCKPVTEFFAPKPSPKKAKVESPRKLRKIAFGDFGDCLRPFGTLAKFGDDSKPLPDFGQSSNDLDFFEEQFKVLNSCGSLSDVDMEIIENHLSWLVQSWRLEMAQKFVQMCASCQNQTGDKQWSDFVLKLKNRLNDLVDEYGL